MARFLSPRKAAKTFGIFLAVEAVVLLCFGGPGVCGLTGGLLTEFFPQSATVGIIGMLSFFIFLLGLLISLLWLAVSGIFWIFGTRTSSES